MISLWSNLCALKKARKNKKRKKINHLNRIFLQTKIRNKSFQKFNNNCLHTKKNKASNLLLCMQSRRIFKITVELLRSLVKVIKNLNKIRVNHLLFKFQLQLKTMKISNLICQQHSLSTIQKDLNKTAQT